MDSLQDRITQAYYRLIDYFLSGVLAFIVLKTLREEYQKHEEIEDDIFAGSLVISAYNTAILALANTLKPNSASIHLPYLINCIKDSRDRLDAKSYNEFVTFAYELQTALTEISQITDRVIELRDTTVAHLDRKHVNNPSSLFNSPPIKWDDLELAYNIIGSGFMEIGRFLDLDTNTSDYIIIANSQLAEKTRQVYKLLYGAKKY